jgi:hypothetical protein
MKVRSVSAVLGLCLFGCAGETAVLGSGESDAGESRGTTATSTSRSSSGSGSGSSSGSQSTSQTTSQSGSSSQAASSSVTDTGEVVVLFGGLSGDAALGYLNDTWTWDGSAWFQHEAPGPTARNYSAMTFSGRVAVLYGGDNENVQSDTWTWDGDVWVHLDESGPQPRAAAAATTMPDGTVLLFGGQTNNLPVTQTNPPFADPWTWNDNTWTELDVKTPSQRTGAVMATRLTKDSYAPVMLFGGIDETNTTLGDTYTWDGNVWNAETTCNASGQCQSIPGPPPRAYASVAALGSGLVLFGGVDGSNTMLGDTWTWTGKEWIQNDVTGPSPRAGAAMATLGDTVVLFGGNFLSDTWTWDGTRWTQHDVPGPSARTGAVMSPSAPGYCMLCRKAR